MRCPRCGHLEDKVLDSRTSRSGDLIRRRRACLGCNHRFTTREEVVRARLNVIKRDGRILCEATSTLACVDRSGRPTPIPEDILQNTRKQPITPHTDRINP